MHRQEECESVVYSRIIDAHQRQEDLGGWACSKKAKTQTMTISEGDFTNAGSISWTHVDQIDSCPKAIKPELFESCAQSGFGQDVDTELIRYSTLDKSEKSCTVSTKANTRLK